MKFAPADRLQTSQGPASSSTDAPAQQEATAVVPDSLVPVHDDSDAEGLFSPFDDDDTTNFHEVVNDDILMRENAAALAEEDDVDGKEDSAMMSLMDVLQCLGVAAEDACCFAAYVVKNKPRFEHLRKTFEEQQQLVHAISEVKPTFMELYGRGKLVEASHGCRRNLNVAGLDALDLRTCKADGTAWDFNLSSDRQEAIELIKKLKPTWVIGSPPCTAFSRLNLGLNFPKMQPEVVKQKVAEGIRHLHFMLTIYKLQMDAGRFFFTRAPPGRIELGGPMDGPSPGPALCDICGRRPMHVRFGHLDL